MKKISLDVDKLKVTSFEPETGEDAQRGTVHGNATLGCNTAFRCETAPYNTYCESCQMGSCYDSCAAPGEPAC